MIRSVLALRAQEGKSGALEDFYAGHGVLEKALQSPGCRAAVLLRSADGGPDTHLVTADWDCRADYQRWVDNPWRAAVTEQLAELLQSSPDEPIVGRLFEFV